MVRRAGADARGPAHDRRLAVTPEFSRPERVDTIGEGERVVAIEARPEERAALARRFGLVAVERLEATYRVRREAAGILARGQVTASVVQACSVTDEPLTVGVDEAVDLRFVESLGDAEEVELDETALDTIPIEGGAVDLGEAAAETMALALDPFPRGPNAAAALRAAGVVSEDEVEMGPFAGLKARLEGR
nr:MULTISPECIES: DUF177 domain-containing protein [unclassified Sphingomonas]